MFKLKGVPRTETVTAALAKRFAEMEPFVRERPMSDVRLKVYDKEWSEGHFRPVTWAAAFCKETAATCRVNGQHTSYMATLVDLKDRPPLIATVEWYECDTLEDVARLYNTFDNRMQSRNTTDINRAFAAVVPQLADVPLPIVNMCVSGYWYARYQERYTQETTPQDRAEMLVDHFDFVRWYASVLPKEKQHNHLRRMAVCAAAYATYVRAPRIATQFWEAVRDETASEPTNPTRKLGKFLLLTFVKRTNSGGDKNCTNREFFVRCLQHWNSWRKDEAAPKIYRADTPIPEAS